MNPSVGTTISTLPVITKCHITATDEIQMIVVIRDRDNLIQADFAKGNEVLEILYDESPGNEQTCNITKADNGLEYFKVCKRDDYMRVIPNDLFLIFF